VTVTPRTVLMAIGFTVVAVAVLVGSALLAKTPGSTIDGDILNAPNLSGLQRTVVYELPEGASAGQVGSDLAELGVIRSSRQFQVLLALMGLQAELSAGVHELQLGMPIPSVIQALLVQEAIPVITVTFPEGIRIEEMAVRAAEAGFGTGAEFLDAVDDAQLSLTSQATLPEGQGLQGYLFPDTYILPEGSTAADLVKVMIQTFEQRVTRQLRAAFEDKGLDLHQAITLASIVEREAVLAEERPLIAGVFLNRIEAGDSLGADPTVQFAVAEDPASVAEFGWWKTELTLLDLDNPSPYNTRKWAGLPPGPITNPGLAAIEAVAFAEDTRMYYFVADAIAGDGSHLFAETFAEHEANIARVQ
jgi:peptidoglycan lytic transglycosylase G